MGLDSTLPKPILCSCFLTVKGPDPTTVLPTPVTHHEPPEVTLEDIGHCRADINRPYFPCQRNGESSDLELRITWLPSTVAG